MKRYAVLLGVVVIASAVRARGADASATLAADVVTGLEAEFSGAELAAAKRFMAASEQERAAWRRAIRDTHPGEGGFTLEFPSTAWNQVECAESENEPLNMGGGYGERSLYNYSSYLNSATGHFAANGSSSLTTTCESDSAKGTNYFTVQLNTDRFPSPAACSGSPASDCKGWEQFVYRVNGSSQQGSGFIEFWIRHYNKPCPNGWHTYQPGDGTTSCWKDSGAVSIPSHTVTILDSDHTYVQGWIYDSTHEAVMVTLVGTAYSHVAGSNLYPQGVWGSAQFNVYGWGNGSQANFSCTMQLYPAMYSDDTIPNDAACDVGSSTTGETNNLTPNTCFTVSSPPGIYYREYHIH